MKSHIIEGLRRVAVRISNRHFVDIEFGGWKKPETDGWKIKLPKILNRKKHLDECQAYTSHESGHIGYGSFSHTMAELRNHLVRRYNMMNPEAQELVEVLEDYRVDQINKKIFPGFARILDECKKEQQEGIKRGEDFFLDLSLFLEGFEPEVVTKKHEDQQKYANMVRELMNANQSIASTVYAADLIGRMLQRPHMPDPESNRSDSNKYKKHQKNIYDKKMIDHPTQTQQSQHHFQIDQVMRELMNFLKDKDMQEILDTIKQMILRGMAGNKGNQLAKPVIEDFRNLNDQGILEYLEKLVLESILKQEKVKRRREVKVIEEDIQKKNMDIMDYSDYTYKAIVRRNRQLIEEFRKYFKIREIANEKFHRYGRLNNSWIKAVTSDYKYPFTRKIEVNKVPITVLVDISGSMCFERLKVAKEACVVFCEALKDVVNLRLVLYTGVRDEYNIVVKDFNKPLIPEKVDWIGGRRTQGQNLDGASALFEAKKNRNGVVVMFSDGRPTGERYGMEGARPDFHEARKYANIFGFVIDHSYGATWVEDLYQKSYTVIESHDTKKFREKFLRFGKMIVDNFQG